MQITALASDEARNLPHQTASSVNTEACLIHIWTKYLHFIVFLLDLWRQQCWSNDEF